MAAIASAAGGKIERVSLSRPAPHHVIRIAGTSRYRTAPGRSSGSGGWQNPLLAAIDRQNPGRGLLDFSQCILNWQKLWAMLDRDRFRGCFCAGFVSACGGQIILRRDQCDARRDNPALFPELFLGREAGCAAAASWSIYVIAE